MSLLEAPEYNEGKEKARKATLIGGLSFIVLVAVLAFAGFALGHGWLFSNLPIEHKVNNFFNALEAKDYKTAYAIYTNDPDWQQHLDKHASYPLDRFTEDWTTESPVGGPIVNHHVDISKTDGSGTFGSSVIVAVTVNGTHRIFLLYVRKDGSLTYPSIHVLQY